MAKPRMRRAARTRRRALSRAASSATVDPNAPGPVDLAPLCAPLATIAKSFAVVALRLAPNRPATTGDRAVFLDGLGLSTSEIAAILGSTHRSIAELVARARRK